jgi:hypothetical protein
MKIEKFGCNDITIFPIFAKLKLFGPISTESLHLPHDSASAFWALLVVAPGELLHALQHSTATNGAEYCASIQLRHNYTNHYQDAFNEL